MGDWRDRAVCRDEDPELFFPASNRIAAAHPAMAVCRRCPVTGDCLSWSLRTGQDHGVWGGLTAPQRRRRRRGLAGVR